MRIFKFLLKQRPAVRVRRHLARRGGPRRHHRSAGLPRPLRLHRLGRAALADARRAQAHRGRRDADALGHRRQLAPAAGHAACNEEFINVTSS